MNLVFTGPPGAGKGTQAAMFHARHGAPHVSTGDMLREAVRDATDLGERASAYMRRGDLVPDELVDAIVRARLAREDCSSGFILDGYPRTLQQARVLGESLARHGRRLDAAVLFAIRDEVLLERLVGRRVCVRCGATYHLSHKRPRTAGRCDLDGMALELRKDDDAETVRHRVAVFRELTGPMVEYYRGEGLLLQVDAELPILKIYKEIRRFIDGRSPRPRRPARGVWAARLGAAPIG